MRLCYTSTFDDVESPCWREMIARVMMNMARMRVFIDIL